MQHSLLLVRPKKPVKPQKKEVKCVSFPDFEWIEAFSSNADLVSWSALFAVFCLQSWRWLPDTKSQQLSPLNDGRFPRCSSSSSKFQRFIHGRSSCIMDYLEYAGEWQSLPFHRKKPFDICVCIISTGYEGCDQPTSITVAPSVLNMWSIKFGKMVKNVHQCFPQPEITSSN